jgi:DNA invertase Pin-like site-specific DNA recombinase
MIPVALYLRMSTDVQEHSIPDQRKALVTFAGQHKYKIVAEYLDEGISGDRTEKRAGFLQMIADCGKGKFQRILCWDQDRFGRFDPLEAGYWIQPMRAAGVMLHTIAQGLIDWSQFESRILYSLAQEGKHAFLRDMSRNVIRGLARHCKDGQWHGHVPIGYEKGPDGRLVLGDPTEIAAVREAYRLRLLGFGYRNIANRLNASGAPTPMPGKPWQMSAVRDLLTRETYLGVWAFGKKPTGKYNWMVNGEVAKAEKGRKPVPIRMEGNHPAIIDQATWDAAQSVRASKPKPRARGCDGGAALSGLVYCGVCGAVMHARSMAGHPTTTKAVYICSTNMATGGCGYCSFGQKDLLAGILEMIREKVLLESVDELEKWIAKKLKAKKSVPTVDNRANLAKRLAKLNAQIFTAVERMTTVHERLVPELEQKLLALQDERESVTAELSRPDSSRKRLSPRVIAETMWEQFGGNLEERPTEELRARLGKIIKRIDMHYKKGPKTGRGQRWVFDRATVQLANGYAEKLVLPYLRQLFCASTISLVPQGKWLIPCDHVQSPARCSY